MEKLGRECSRLGAFYAALLFSACAIGTMARATSVARGALSMVVPMAFLVLPAFSPVEFEGTKGKEGKGREGKGRERKGRGMKRKMRTCTQQSSVRRSLSAGADPVKLWHVDCCLRKDYRMTSCSRER